MHCECHIFHPLASRHINPRTHPDENSKSLVQSLSLIYNSYAMDWNGNENGRFSGNLKLIDNFLFNLQCTYKSFFHDYPSSYVHRCTLIKQIFHFPLIFFFYYWCFSFFYMFYAFFFINQTTVWNFLCINMKFQHAVLCWAFVPTPNNRNVTKTNRWFVVVFCCIYTIMLFYLIYRTCTNIFQFFEYKHVIFLFLSLFVHYIGYSIHYMLTTIQHMIWYPELNFIHKFVIKICIVFYSYSISRLDSSSLNQFLIQPPPLPPLLSVIQSLHKINIINNWYRIWCMYIYASLLYWYVYEIKAISILSEIECSSKGYFAYERYTFEMLLINWLCIHVTHIHTYSSACIYKFKDNLHTLPG